MNGQRTLLLFSGGLDSTALAALLRPELLFVDYGQRPAKSEKAAATRIAELLELQLHAVELGIGDFGAGLLHGGRTVPDAPSPEWWPYRNQFLATAAAAFAIQTGCESVALGSVCGDGERHRDGSADFYRLLNELVSFQEGGVTIDAPAIGLTTEDLLRDSALPDSMLGWTFSCHRSNRPCGSCPGCWKRRRVLSSLGIQGYIWNDGS